MVTYTRVTVPFSRIILDGDGGIVRGGDALRRTIEEYGLIQQEAAVLKQEDDGRYRIIDGRHRVKALMELGRLEAECIVVGGDTSEFDVAKLALIANIHRANNPAVESIMMKRLVDGGMTHDQTAQALHISRSQVTKRIQLSMLTPCLFDALRDGLLRASVARELCRMPVEEQRAYEERFDNTEGGGERLTLREAHEARRLSVARQLGVADSGVRRAVNVNRGAWLAGELERYATQHIDDERSNRKVMQVVRLLRRD